MAMALRLGRRTADHLWVHAHSQTLLQSTRQTVASRLLRHKTVLVVLALQFLLFHSKQDDNEMIRLEDQRMSTLTSLSCPCRRKKDLHETHERTLKLLPRAVSPQTKQMKGRLGSRPAVSFFRPIITLHGVKKTSSSTSPRSFVCSFLSVVFVVGVWIARSCSREKHSHRCYISPSFLFLFFSFFSLSTASAFVAKKSDERRRFFLVAAFGELLNIPTSRSRAKSSSLLRRRIQSNLRCCFFLSVLQEHNVFPAFLTKSSLNRFPEQL